jgi:hypothetical protein
MPATNAPGADTISLVVTDAAGTVYPQVVLTGNETPPYSWPATYAAGQASAAETDLDSSGAVIATPGPWLFSVQAAVSPGTFEQGTGVMFQSNASPAVAALHAKLTAAGPATK